MCQKEGEIIRVKFSTWSNKRRLYKYMDWATWGHMVTLTRELDWELDGLPLYFLVERGFWVIHTSRISAQQVSASVPSPGSQGIPESALDTENHLKY